MKVIVKYVTTAAILVVCAVRLAVVWTQPIVAVTDGAALGAASVRLGTEIDDRSFVALRQMTEQSLAQSQRRIEALDREIVQMTGAIKKAESDRQVLSQSIVRMRRVLASLGQGQSEMPTAPASSAKNQLIVENAKSLSEAVERLNAKANAEIAIVTDEGSGKLLLTLDGSAFLLTDHDNPRIGIKRIADLEPVFKKLMEHNIGTVTLKAGPEVDSRELQTLVSYLRRQYGWSLQMEGTPAPDKYSMQLEIDVR